MALIRHIITLTLFGLSCSGPGPQEEALNERSESSRLQSSLVSWKTFDYSSTSQLQVLAALLVSFNAALVAHLGVRSSGQVRLFIDGRSHYCSHSRATHSVKRDRATHNVNRDRPLCMCESNDPYKVLGVARDASLTVIRRCYRQRCLQLHPDVAGEDMVEEYKKVCKAFEELINIEPGSLETHPKWHELGVLDQYWARENGYCKTAVDLENWLVSTGRYAEFEDEDDETLNVLGPGVLDEVSASGILALVGYRVFKGNPQWRVRWSASEDSGEEEESWEMFAVLDTEDLKRQAVVLQQDHDSEVH